MNDFSHLIINNEKSHDISFNYRNLDNILFVHKNLVHLVSQSHPLQIVKNIRCHSISIISLNDHLTCKIQYFWDSMIVKCKISFNSFFNHESCSFFTLKNKILSEWHDTSKEWKKSCQNGMVLKQSRIEVIFQSHPCLVA